LVCWIENRTRTIGHDLVLAAQLVNELAKATDERQLSETIARYRRVDLFCLDLSRVATMSRGKSRSLGYLARVLGQGPGKVPMLSVSRSDTPVRV